MYCSPLLHRSLDCSLHFLLFAHVTLEKDESGWKLLFKFLHGMGVHVGDRDSGSLGVEKLESGMPEALGSSGDEDHRILCHFHDYLFIVLERDYPDY